MSVEVRDTRRGFSWVGNDEMRALRFAFEARERTVAIAVYVAMCEAANSNRGASFQASRARVAKAAGVSVKTFDRVAGALVQAGLVTIEGAFHESGAQARSIYTLLAVKGGDTPTTPGGHADHRGGDTPTTGGEGDGGDTPTTPSQETESKKVSSKKVMSVSEEPEGFAQWLGQHTSLAATLGVQVSVPRAETSRRGVLARTFRRLRDEGHELEEFRLASMGVVSSEFMREGGHVQPENVLRVEKFGKWVDEGRRAHAVREAKASGHAVDWSQFDV